MAGMVITFVDVFATLRCPNKTEATFALTFDTDLRTATVRVDGTPRFAQSSQTDFPRETVIVAIADFGASIIGTSFADGTIRVVVALKRALVFETSVTIGTVLVGLASEWDADAALVRRRIALKVLRTSTYSFMVLARANCVGATRAFQTARVLALVIDTRLV